MHVGIPLKYFMWAHQHTTQKNIQRYAEELFQEISPRLKPRVFLLGILREKKETEYVRHPICIQPEECGIDVTLFKDVDAVANSVWEKDERRRMVYTVPYLHAESQNDVRMDSMCSAVQQLVDKNFKGKNIISFVSRPVHLEGYDVFVVLQFNKNTYNSFHGLGVNPKFPRISLFDSLIQRFLGESLDTMYRSRAAAHSQYISTDKKEVMRAAALDFVDRSIAKVCESDSSWAFLDTCNYVSSLKYEGDVSIGKLIICQKEHPNLDIVLKLISPIELTEYKKFRKLLEIASRDLSLYSDGTKILGWGKIKGKYDEQNQDLLTINFNGSYKWELVHGSHTMLVVEHTVPSLPKIKIKREIFDDLLKRTFLAISPENIENLWRIVSAAEEQKHGALLIISNESEEEANRLANQSTVIEPTLLNESLIINVTSIDGAILLDSNGICHSIGIILDGISTDKGTSERGARYNSAIRYVENNKKKCIAVIISEDGMVDLYPDLLPRIKQSTIKKNLTDLRELANNDVLDDDKYMKTMNWIEDHRFYLSKEQCDEINTITALYHEQEKKDPYQFFIPRNNLQPNNDMNDSYFIAE